MKKILLISSMAIFALACNNNDAKDAKTGDTTKVVETKMADVKLPDMAYSLDKPYQNWQTGDPQNAATVMKGLKAYETGDIATCTTVFGDSVELDFDYFHATLLKDSLKTFFTTGRDMYSSISIKMQDWESVISADKKDQWVTLWYKQYSTDKKGHVDSLGVINDAKIVNGKIVVLDEKTQHLGPAPKK